MTPIEMPTDWGLLLGMVVIALVIAGLIWWHRTNPSVAKKDLQELLTSLKPQPPAPAVDPLFYDGRHFPTEAALNNYKMAQATLAQYPPKG